MHFLVNLQAICIFIDLNCGVITVHANDLAHKFLRPDMHNLAHREITHVHRFYNRPVDKGDNALFENLGVIIWGLQSSFLPKAKAGAVQPVYLPSPVSNSASPD